MTEQEWLACDDPVPMLEHVADRASARELRLFGCAACRSVWVWIDDPRCRAAVEAAEEFADGLISEAQLASASTGANEAQEAATIANDGARAYIAYAATYISEISLPPSS